MFQFTDGIIIKNEKNPEKFVIFNTRSWVEIIKGIIIQYANKTAEEAESLVANSFLIANFNIDTYMDVVLYSHEYEYHWAMLIAHGNMYWYTKGISSEPPEGYDEWEAQYRKDHGLAEDSFVFSNE